MKKFASLCTICLISIACTAQRITLSKSTSLDPPKKMSRTTKNEASSLATKNFGKSKSLARIIRDNSDKVYTVDDLVVFINSAPITKQLGYLKTIKITFDDISPKNSEYSSKIETIGGKDVFIRSVVSEGIKLYRYITINRAEDFVVIGFVQYKPGEELKARKVLEDLIKGIKFSN